MARNSVLFALAALAATPALAGSTFEIPEGFPSMTLLREPSVRVGTRVPRCPPNAMCDPVSFAELTFGLNGCLDRLGPVTVQQSHTRGGKITLYVTAYNLNNPDSARVRCIRQPTASVTVTLGMGILTERSVEVRSASELVSAE